MVNVTDYVALQKELLQLEREEEKRESIASGDGKRLSSLELRGLAICRLSIESSSTDVGGRQMVRLVTRGGRQLAPARISTGDLVAIREQKGRASAADSSSPSLITEGVVKAMDEKSVEVACDEPIGDDFDSSSLVAVTKLTSDVTHKRYTNSLDSLEKAADDPTHAAYSLTRILFGESVPRFQTDIRLNAKQKEFLATLNDKQKDAVIQALKAKDLAVIHGPPGTGKTHTLIAYIMIEVLRGARVLVVAPSNVAVDNIAERLASVTPAPEFVRAGHSARIMPKVLKYSLEHQVQMTDEAKLAGDIRDELNDLETKGRKACDRSKFREIRTEKRRLRKELRQREKSAVRRLLSAKDVVLSTISGAGARVLDIAENTSPFDVVIVDEAAQALEAACWVSLLRARKAVLAGDPHQLAGTVKSGIAESRGLKRSVLDRVFSTESLRPAICMLATQYRMNAVISTWSSQEFYHGELQPDTSVADRKVIDMDSCSNKEDKYESLIHPFVLIDTAGGDCEEEEPSATRKENLSGEGGLSSDLHTSRSNKGEAQIVIEMVSTFIQSGISLQDVGVISPYSGQVELLRNLLWPKYGRSLEIATIDSFQGREKEIVCMSLVRSNEAGEVGFLSDNRRLNVAITRAKRCVIVVCDTETISTHPFLARMVEYVETHGFYRSAVVDFPDIVGTFSQARRPKEAIEALEKSDSSQKKHRRLKRPKPKITETGNGRAEGENISIRHTAVERGVEESEDLRERLRGEIKVFLAQNSNFEKLFSKNLSAHGRKIVHELAEEYGLKHQSVGTQSERRIEVSKPKQQREGKTTERIPVQGISADEVSRSMVEEPSSTIPRKGTDFERGETIQVRFQEETQSDDSSDGKSSKVETEMAGYKGMNSMLHDLSIAREGRVNTGTGEQKPSENVAQQSRRKASKQRKNGRKTEDHDEDFDAILARYGANPVQGGPSRFAGPVAQIVDGKLTKSVTAPKNNADARRKLAAKLSKEAEKRKRKSKK